MSQGDVYYRDIEGAKLTLIADRIRKFLTCPIDWDTKWQLEPMRQILLEKWFHTVGKSLPPGEVFPDYLRGYSGDEYLNAPGEDNYDWSRLLDPENESDETLRYQAKRMAEILYVEHGQMRSEYSRSCGHLLKARALTDEDYRKHYAASGAKNCEEVKQLSLQPANRDIGLLLPPLTCDVQEYALWLGLSLLLERRMHSVLDSSSCSRQEAFDIAWNDTVGNSKSHGFVLDCLTTVGAYNGQVAEKLVFDLSLQSGEFHCYPTIDVSSAMEEVAADNLQGMASAFDAGRNFELALLIG